MSTTHVRRFLLAAQIARVRSASRSLHTTRPALAQQGNHTADSYTREVDSSPAPDASIHRLDPTSERVQKPHEPPSGPWSRVGVESAEYQHVEGAGSANANGERKKEPYAPEGGSQGMGSYGAQKVWRDDKGKETSGREEGPEAGSSGGRK